MKTSKQTLTTGKIKKLCMKGLGLNAMYTLNDDFIKNKETFSQLWNQKQNWTHCSLKQAGLWFTLSPGVSRTAGAEILQPLRLGTEVVYSPIGWLSRRVDTDWLAAKYLPWGHWKGLALVLLLCYHGYNTIGLFQGVWELRAFSVPPELGCNCAVDNESWKLCNLCVVLLTAGEEKPQERENPPSSVGMRITPKKSQVNPVCHSLNW